MRRGRPREFFLGGLYVKKIGGTGKCRKIKKKHTDFQNLEGFFKNFELFQVWVLLPETLYLGPRPW